MQFYVDHVEFDFDEYDDAYPDELDDNYKQEILDNNIGMWDADDEDDLIEEITCASGWCIKSIDYRIIGREM